MAKSQRQFTIFSIKAKRPSLKQQIQLFQILGQMLRNGFSIAIALQFMMDFLPDQRNWLQVLRKQLRQGDSLARAFKRIGIHQEILDQLAIADQHGQLIVSLQRVTNWLEIKQKQTKKIRQLLNYPILLVVMLLGCFLVMRLFITPQLQDLGGTPLVLPKMIFWVPACIGTMLVVLMGVLYYRYRYLNAYQRVLFKVKLPLIGQIYLQYYQYLVCSNLAVLLGNGLNLSELLFALSRLSKESLFSQISLDIKCKLSQGKKLEKIVAFNPILPNDLIIFMKRGTTLSLLAEELNIYSELLFETLVARLNRLLLLIQPLAFLFVASIVVLIYLQLLLPIYKTMGNV
ncbi:type II secretion system F family protein [Agrilactobacillus fermenti]|uniref:type II secretion system F family protein n=1 Tax=Agrilactobacillus fermenti TaxID=2586909 RepID=UPI003A5BEDEF